MTRKTTFFAGTMFAAVATGLSPVAMAQAADSCAPRAADIYFERNASDLTQYADLIVERMAAEMKSCADARLVIEAGSGALAQRRAEKIDAAMARQGVDADIRHVSGVRLTPVASRESVLDRSVTVRVVPSNDDLS